ncbi:MAG: hypothetical protein EZS28_040303, partial [Streblomastix strix]
DISSSYRSKYIVSLRALVLSVGSIPLPMGKVSQNGKARD